ncbi:proline-rich protein PRCC-like [Galendromus occidentalis]|uniref:Proline-rich protein PRCC-like n=1 Tax=Galendromus occidentalis TaxID=34638 RepID=A0AAJ6QSC6_9ACAR|nr:proline-rich protein PRCC-like [Galendromus occidentalis]
MIPEPEDKVETLPKPSKRQIFIPKLSELDEDDDDEPMAKKRIVKSSAMSNLLKMLPPPTSAPIAKGSLTKLTQLTPHSLGKKPLPPKPKPKPKAPLQAAAPGPGGDDDDGDTPSTFFSFEEPKLSEEQLKKLVAAEDIKPREKRPPSPEVGPVLPTYLEPAVEPEPLPAVSASGSQDIPEEALQKLRGRRQEKIEIFSIDAADFTAEARSNLSKNLTVEDSRPSLKEGPELSRLHKSKHHITHLAFQAKARENELKNQWATNRMTKRETQKKYGF